MTLLRASALLVVVVLAIGQLAAGQQAPPREAAQPAAGDRPAPPAQGSRSEGASAPQAERPQPTFRGGISFVRVDVSVTDRKSQPVTDLKQTDFEVFEDGRPQSIEQFRLIKVDGTPRPGQPPPRQIRNRADEELEANRDDVRVFAFLLDDYHVRLANSMSVREPLTRFVQTQVQPADLVTVMYPLTPVTDLDFTRDHAGLMAALQRFEGRKFDYTPRNQFEQNYARYPTETVERIRNEVVMGALKGLAVRLGSLREGRKSIIFVSEGFTAMLPPQMRRADASQPGNPIEAALAAGGQDSPMQMTAEWFGQADLFSRLREVYEAANRNNASIYSVDPRGLAPFEYGFDDLPGGPPPSFATDRRALQMTQDTLRTLSEETDGRAIVNRNNLAAGMAQIIADSSFYYLIGYTSTQAQNDGKFHQISVRVKRRDLDVRARKGYWALTAADVERVANPTPEVAKPVQQALASISASVQAAKYVRTWIGTERGGDGKTRVTFVWEPLPQTTGVRREAPGRVTLLAADARGNLVFRGRSSEAAPAATALQGSNGSGPARGIAPAAGAGSTPQRITFEAPPGKVELRMTVEGGSGGTLDQEIRTVEVPDLTAPEAAISTPRIHRARNAREFQTLAADAAAVPVAGREFSRTERLLIRFDAYGAGTDRPSASAVLLNRAGQKISDVPVAPATAGGSHQIDLGLSSIPGGDYVVEITVRGASGEAKELVPLRVGS
jgi:VWFA-related protein